VKNTWLVDGNGKIKKDEDGMTVNRYKNGRILIGVKGASFCLMVSAAVGQKHIAGNQFAKTYDVDQFVEGTPVPCK
jgi:hypothetical protein